MAYNKPLLGLNNVPSPTRADVFGGRSSGMSSESTQGNVLGAGGVKPRPGAQPQAEQPSQGWQPQPVGSNTGMNFGGLLQAMLGGVNNNISSAGFGGGGGGGSWQHNYQPAYFPYHHNSGTGFMGGTAANFMRPTPYIPGTQTTWAGDLPQGNGSSWAGDAPFQSAPQDNSAYANWLNPLLIAAAQNKGPSRPKQPAQDPSTYMGNKAWDGDRSKLKPRPMPSNYGMDK